MAKEPLSGRDRIFWASVGIVSILSIYFVSTFLISRQSDSIGFTNHRYLNQYSIKVPPYLLPDDSLNNNAVLAFSDFSNEVYLIVVEEKKRDLKRKDLQPALAEYFSYLKSNITEKMDTFLVTTTNDHFVDGMHVITSEINGSINGVELFYVFSAYETELAFIQVRGWSSKSAKLAVKKDLFTSIQSFRVLNDSGK